MLDLVDRYSEWRMRRSFGASARMEFYETLSMLLSNNVKLDDALSNIYDVYSEDGQKPAAPRAQVVARLIESIHAGHRLSVAMAPLVGYAESSMISGGELSGNLTETIGRVIRMVQRKKAIMGAIAKALTYPAFLSMGMIYAINMVATQMVPKFAKMTDPQTWDGSAYALYAVTQYYQNYGGLTLIALVLAVILTVASMPYLRGPVRVFLDRLFPWSLYRMMHGSTFLLNVGTMVSAGNQMKSALDVLSQSASPWLKERIDAANYGVSLGMNLGEALQNAGHDFPDRNAVRFLRVIAGQEGFETAIVRFGETWMDESVKKVQATGNFVLGAGIAAMGAMMLFLMAGASGMTDALTSGLG